MTKLPSAKDLQIKIAEMEGAIRSLTTEHLDACLGARDFDFVIPADDGGCSTTRVALIDTINLERELLGPLREVSTVIDTSLLRPAQLRTWIRNIVQAAPARLTLVFESFAFKRGVPLDADYVFDVRMLPNPHYEPHLKALTGRDQGVIDYLKASDDVLAMQTQIAQFVRNWLPALKQDHRAYVTVAIGCTGGQHRSVYLVEQLARAFTTDWPVLIRHRELG